MILTLKFDENRSSHQILLKNDNDVENI